MTLQLLIEQRWNATGNPPQREIAILTDATHHKSGLIQGAHDQPPAPPSAECQIRVAGPVTLGTRQKPQKGIYQRALVTGDSRQRSQARGQLRKLNFLASCWPGQALPRRRKYARKKKCGAQREGMARAQGELEGWR
jgi:hypothetical protein